MKSGYFSLLLLFLLISCSGGSGSHSAGDSNQAPILDYIADIVVAAGEDIIISPTASDPDGDGLTFSYSGWMTGSSYTTVVDDVGVHKVSVTVSDGKLRDSQVVTVVVSNIEAPVILFTDIVSGPHSGGENNEGAYLSLFGLNFGGAATLGTGTKVYINNVEVARYKYLGLAESQFLGEKKPLQKLSVQTGAIGNPPGGAELPIKLVVNGLQSNTDHTFIVQPGDILYVDPLSGNDDTAQKNDISKPWQHVQTDIHPISGAVGQMQPGDTIVMRGGTYHAAGFDGHFMKMFTWTGSAPNGVTGNGYYSYMAYPGEKVTIIPAGGGKGGIHGTSSAFSAYGDYVQIANLRIEGGNRSVIDGPVNLQTASDHWRVVNNELCCWDAEDTDSDTTKEARSGGLAGEGSDAAFLGNHIHHIGGGTLNHGIYLGSGDRVEIAYNHIHDMTGGNIIQTHDATGVGGMNDVDIHHNLMHDGNRYGMNMAVGTNTLRFRNNIVYNTDYSGLRINVKNGTLIEAFNNTFYNVVVNAAPFYGAIYNTWDTTTVDVQIKNNIVYPSPTASFYYSNYAIDTGITLENNLYYGIGAAAPARDSNPFTGDPLFVNTTGHDFHPGSGSPAIDNGLTIAGVPDDFDFSARPQGVAYDIGAYEY